MDTDPRSSDPGDVERFDRLAAEWWNPEGPMRVLHAVNPARIGFVRSLVVERRGVDPEAPGALRGLRALDIGCGAGLVAEPLARMGARVTAIDAAPAPVSLGRRRAGEEGLAVDYRVGTVQDVTDGPFDLVTALEVVEHVPDREAFLSSITRRVAPGGLLVLSTLNRTLRSLAIAIAGAEYIARVVPRGTHRFSRFVRPAEMARSLVREGMTVERIRGLAYRPLSRTWSLSRDPGVNYLLAATRPAAERP